jgi:hypothetical protein
MTEIITIEPNDLETLQAQRLKLQDELDSAWGGVVSHYQVDALTARIQELDKAIARRADAELAEELANFAAEDYLAERACPMCGCTETTWEGRLGRREHRKCRACGITYTFEGRE